MKTPKEEAKEEAQILIESFETLNFQHAVDTDEDYGMSYEYHKKCALFCVKKMKDVIPMYTGNLNPVWKYWEEVRKELELL